MIAYLLESARSATIGRRPADISHLRHGDDFGGFDDLGNLEGSRLRSAEMRRRSASQARLSMRGFVVARQVIAKLERLEGALVELGGFASGLGLPPTMSCPRLGSLSPLPVTLTRSSTRAPHSAQ